MVSQGSAGDRRPYANQVGISLMWQIGGCDRLAYKGGFMPSPREVVLSLYGQMEPFGALLNGGFYANRLEEMVGTRRLELLTSTVSR